MDNGILILMGIFSILIIGVIASVLILHAQSKKKELLEAGGYQVSSLSEIGTRQEQQDAFWFSGMGEMPKRMGNGELYCNDQTFDGRGLHSALIHGDDDFLAVVADGMGGMQNGGQISRIIASEMKNAFFCQNRPADPVDFLQNALWKVNERVNEYLNTGQKGRGGSTIIAAYVRDHQLYYMSVGDSRIYLSRNKKIVKLNIEHNFGNDLDDLAAHGIISQEEAKENRKRAALTSYVGMGEIKRVDGNIVPIPLEKDDCILLMTDGVFGTIQDQEILRCIKDSDSRKNVIELCRSVERCNKKKQDNYSVIAIRVL